MMELPLRGEARRLKFMMMSQLVLGEAPIFLIVKMNWLPNKKKKKRMARKSTLLAHTVRRIRIPKRKRLALQLRAAALAET